MRIDNSTTFSSLIMLEPEENKKSQLIITGKIAAVASIHLVSMYASYRFFSSSIFRASSSDGVFAAVSNGIFASVQGGVMKANIIPVYQRHILKNKMLKDTDNNLRDCAEYALTTLGVNLAVATFGTFVGATGGLVYWSFQEKLDPILQTYETAVAPYIHSITSRIPTLH